VIERAIETQVSPERLLQSNLINILPFRPDHFELAANPLRGLGGAREQEIFVWRRLISAVMRRPQHGTRLAQMIPNADSRLQLITLG
jgi:hypothetical protein